MYYPIHVQAENDAFVLTCRDLPEFNAVSYSVEDIEQQAKDGLESVFMLYMDLRKPIPSASAIQANEQAVYLPVRVSTKVALYNEMLAQHITKAELARRLTCGQKQIDRLWDLTHSTKLEMLEQAFNALGKRLFMVAQ